MLALFGEVVGLTCIFLFMNCQVIYITVCPICITGTRLCALHRFAVVYTGLESITCSELALG